MQNSFALDAAEMVAQFVAGTRPCHLVQHNHRLLLPIIECPSIAAAAVVDENTWLAAAVASAERLSISNYGPIPPKKDPPVRYSYLLPHLHINFNHHDYSVTKKKGERLVMCRRSFYRQNEMTS